MDQETKDQAEEDQGPGPDTNLSLDADGFSHPVHNRKPCRNPALSSSFDNADIGESGCKKMTCCRGRTPSLLTQEVDGYILWECLIA